MSRHALHAVLAASAVALCCGRVVQKGPTKDAVTVLLQNEAAAMKRDGEKLDPNLGVKATWTIHAVEVQEQTGNDTQPFKGMVRFRINSLTEEPTGPVETNFERTFNYAYDAKLGKWLFKP